MDTEVGLVLASKAQLVLTLPTSEGPETRAVATLTEILKELGEDRGLQCMFQARQMHIAAFSAF